MKPIILNLISVIRRFKMATILNILGLSVAFAAFMVIMIQLDFDYGFDKFHKDYDKIFRVERGNLEWRNAIFMRPFADLFVESSPNVVASTLTTSRAFDVIFTVENDEQNVYEDKIMSVTPSFTNVFTVEFVEGDENALKAPETVIIPLSLARKLFENESSIGKQITIGGRTNLTIGAIFRDFPVNSIFENCIYMPIPENAGGWGSASYCFYILLNDAANAPTLFEDFKRNFDISTLTSLTVHWAEDNFLTFTALEDIHYVKGVDYDFTPKSSRQTLSILFSIAIVIIIIASINFTNFSTALTPMRIKSINTQLVLGARRSMLRSSIASEAVVVSFLAYLLAILLVVLFKVTPLAKLVDGDLSLAAHPLIIGGTALVAIVAGILAGLYPAHYMTSFAPALVLKGSFGLSPKAKNIRSTLIGIQFVASLALIVGAAFMYLQNNFLQNSPLGFDKDNLLTVNMGPIRESRDALTNQLKVYSGIEDVTYGQSLLASSDLYSSTMRKYKEQEIWIQTFMVHHTFLKVMGIKINEGRDFRPEDANTEQGAWIFNEKGREEYGLELNMLFDESKDEVIGFMPDIKFASFREGVRTMGFYVVSERMFAEYNMADGAHLSNAYIKVKAGANMRDAISHINATLREFDANTPFNIRFFDETLQKLYEKEIALNSLITLFSIIAIFISIVGVFGMVVFDSESRRKEIGIRKVLGASTMGIIIMFNKGYFKILAICFVIAAPLAWYAVARWLENFAYRTTMHWWVYLFAFVIVAIITVLTVTFQNWRVANDNPVNAIKSE